MKCRNYRRKYGIQWVLTRATMLKALPIYSRHWHISSDQFYLNRRYSRFLDLYFYWESCFKMPKILNWQLRISQKTLLARKDFAKNLNWQEFFVCLIIAVCLLQISHLNYIVWFIFLNFILFRNIQKCHRRCCNYNLILISYFLGRNKQMKLISRRGSNLKSRVYSQPTSQLSYEDDLLPKKWNW